MNVKSILFKVMNILKRCYCEALFRILILKKHFYVENAIETHLTSAEKYVIYVLASKKYGTFVEIGSYLGASSSFIALACSENRRYSQLYCVDTWQNDAMTEGARETFSVFLTNTKRFERNITPLKCRSAEAAANFTGGIDFLFIDGDHSYEGVLVDVNAWFPLLNPDALVVFHDYAWADGVRRVVHEVVAPRASKTGSLPNLYWAWI